MKNTMELQKLKYVIIIKKDGKAELYFGTKRNNVKSYKFNIDKKYTVQHDVNQTIIKKQIMKHRIVTTSSIFKKESTFTSISGEGFTTVVIKSKEDGFSLVELTISCAIITLLSLIAMPHYMAFQQNITETVSQFETLQP
jgi:prepilin-type N-terminal cleavage/methylation domain-containing protein